MNNKITYEKMDPSEQQHGYIYKSNDGHVFKNEKAAKNFCQMKNEWYEAMEPINKFYALSRSEYEQACADNNTEIMTDVECDSYGVKYGEFAPRLTQDDEIESNINFYKKMQLANCRSRGIEQEKKEQKPEPKKLDYPNGRKLACGCTVYNQSEVMSASRGTSCPDCYDRMSD
jgi:hypothetical protein